MKRIALLLILLSFAAAPASAFVLISGEVSGRLEHPRWDAGVLPVRFKQNDHTLEMLPNFSRSSLLPPAVQASMQAWGSASPMLMLDGSVTTANIAKDGVNLISFADTAVNRDMTTNAWAVAFPWFQERSGGLQMYESDIALNPAARFATDGSRSAADFQGILTHELGHTLGLDHSLMASATMFPAGDPGQTNLRTLDADDLAAQRMLYSGPLSPQLGAISGRVLTTGGVAVFGAHVTAVDGDGVVQCGVVTRRDGTYTLPCLPPGAYRVYAEPLDGPMTPDDLTDPYFHDRRNPILTVFRTTFYGGNETPLTVKVEAGKATAIDPIRVDTQKPTINPWGFLWTEDGQTLDYWVATLRLGRPLFLFMAGPGLERPATAGFTISSTDVAIDYTRVVRDVTDDGIPLVLLTIWQGPRARPGARNLYITAGSERTVLTGIIEVPAP